MRAVLLSVEPEMLDERRRLGLDGRDEMWAGAVHMVPPAGDAQQEVQAELSARGAEGAELVVEVRSAGDETYDKIDWYAARATSTGT